MPTYSHPIICPDCGESDPLFYTDLCFNSISKAQGREVEEEARLRKRERQVEETQAVRSEQ